jgi:hypothetical protein
LISKSIINDKEFIIIVSVPFHRLTGIPNDPDPIRLPEASRHPNKQEIAPSKPANEEDIHPQSRDSGPRPFRLTFLRAEVILPGVIRVAV